ncbi:putative Modifier of rudimentary (Mod(r)) protein [Leishmania utingensis]|uniref:Modifier of rudimentary (Mod(R)) protein n=1 Tax=Leishmania utingensis TaxID=653362 RepID=A0AAW3A9U3_9TRYP
MPQDRSEQLEELRRQFPSTSVVTESAQETVLKVDHALRISPTIEYALSLYVTLPSSFPKAAPKATMPYCCHNVPITPPNINPSEAIAYQWSVATSTLVEAVRNAFQNAADCWGPVEPPSLHSVTLQLSGETDRLLRDLVINPNCLDAYCYQLPIVKLMRKVSRQTMSEIERVANENTTLRNEVETLEAKVKGLQQRIGEQVSQLQQLGQNPLLTSVGTPEALIKTLEDDVRKMSRDCMALGKRAMDAYKVDKGDFQDLLDQYKAQSKEMHMLDLKRISYRAQCTAS